MDIFIDCIKDDLIDLIKSNGFEKYEPLIESSLRFYLVKIE